MLFTQLWGVVSVKDTQTLFGHCVIRIQNYLREAHEIDFYCGDDSSFLEITFVTPKAVGINKRIDEARDAMARAGSAANGRAFDAFEDVWKPVATLAKYAGCKFVVPSFVGEPCMIDRLRENAAAYWAGSTERPAGKQRIIMESEADFPA